MKNTKIAFGIIGKKIFQQCKVKKFFIRHSLECVLCEILKPFFLVKGHVQIRCRKRLRAVVPNRGVAAHKGSVSWCQGCRHVIKIP